MAIITREDTRTTAGENDQNRYNSPFSEAESSRQQWNARNQVPATSFKDTKAAAVEITHLLSQLLSEERVFPYTSLSSKAIGGRFQQILRDDLLIDEFELFLRIAICKDVSPDFGRLIVDLRNLMSGCQEDEDEIPPTDYALTETLKLLFEAREHLMIYWKDYKFPQASVCSTDEGGINVYWRKQGITVQLSVPAAPEGNLFLYHRENDNYRLDRSQVNGRHLADLLRWFLSK